MSAPPVSSLVVAYQSQALALPTEQNSFTNLTLHASPLFKACILRAPLKHWLLPLLCQCWGEIIKSSYSVYELTLLTLTV